MYCEAIEVVVAAAADASPVSSVFVNVSSSISVAVDTVDCSAALPFRVFPVVVAVFVSPPTAYDEEKAPGVVTAVATANARFQRTVGSTVTMGAYDRLGAGLEDRIGACVVDALKKSYHASGVEPKRVVVYRAPRRRKTGRLSDSFCRDRRLCQ